MANTVVHCANTTCRFNDNGCGAFYGLCTNSTEIHAHMFVERIYNETCKYAEDDENKQHGILSIISG